MRWIIILVILSSMSLAAEPTLFFSDLTDGPISGWNQSISKGVAVSVWADNIGRERSTSDLTVCGVTLSRDEDFAEWGATTNPTSARSLKRITFWLNSSMQTGPSTIKVSTTNGTSNEIPFYCRDTGNIYFLSTSGSDSNNGLYAEQGIGNNGPKQTTAWVRKNLIAGDSVYFREGNWTTYDNGSDTLGLPPGLFTFVLDNHGNGIANNSIAITAYPEETVRLGLAKGLGLNGTTRIFNFPGSTGGLMNYWTVSKFQMESRVNIWCENAGSGAGSTHQRIVGNDWSTSYDLVDYPGNGDGVEFQGGGQGKTYLSVYGNYCHDIGVDYRGQDSPRRVYCMYLGGFGQINHVDIAWNEFAWNTAGRGLQVYGHTHNDSVDNLYIHDNYIHDMIRQALVVGGGDDMKYPQTGYSFVQNAWIYNNIFTNPGPYDTLLQVGGYGWGSGGTYHIFNNIIVQPSTYPAININEPNKGTFELNNNIIFTTDINNYYSYYSESVGGGGNGTCIGNHNLYYGAGAGKIPSWDTSILDEIDPQFISSNRTLIYDFQLQATSQAIDSGNSSVSSIVTKDFLGVPREQGEGYDIGAFEYISGFHAADINEDGNISTSEMRTFVTRWRAGEVLLSQVASAIEFWKG